MNAGGAFSLSLSPTLRNSVTCAVRHFMIFNFHVRRSAKNTGADPRSKLANYFGVEGPGATIDPVPPPTPPPPPPPHSAVFRQCLVVPGYALQSEFLLCCGTARRGTGTSAGRKGPPSHARRCCRSHLLFASSNSQTAPVTGVWPRRYI